MKFNTGTKGSLLIGLKIPCNYKSRRKLRVFSSKGTELATNISAVFDKQFTEDKVEAEVSKTLSTDNDCLSFFNLSLIEILSIVCNLFNSLSPGELQFLFTGEKFQGQVWYKL